MRVEGLGFQIPGIGFRMLGLLRVLWGSEGAGLVSRLRRHFEPSVWFIMSPLMGVMVVGYMMLSGKFRDRRQGRDAGLFTSLWP